MQRFSNILFLADGSAGEKFALNRAAILADANNAKLTIFDSIETQDHSTFNIKVNSIIATIRKTQLQERKKELRSLGKKVNSKNPGLRVVINVQTGNLARAAIHEVLVSHHDLVIKAPEGSMGKLKFLFGSTDQKLLRICPCPIWIVKPTRKKRFRKIMAAIDLNTSEPERVSLVKQIMSLSTSLAENEGSELHIVYVWQLSGEARLRGREIDKDVVDNLLEEMQQADQAVLDRLIQHYPYENRTVHLIKGDAKQVIPEFVESSDIDLVIIGTVGRTGIPGLIIGNTAETVLNAINCSVIALKPEGFEVPNQMHQVAPLPT